MIANISRRNHTAELHATYPEFLTKRDVRASSSYIIVISHTDVTSDSAAIGNIHMRSSDCYRQFRNEERRSSRTRMTVTNTLSTVRNIRLIAPGSGLNLMLRNVFYRLHVLFDLVPKVRVLSVHSLLPVFHAGS